MDRPAGIYISNSLKKTSMVAKVMFWVSSSAPFMGRAMRLKFGRKSLKALWNKLAITLAPLNLGFTFIQLLV